MVTGDSVKGASKAQSLKSKDGVRFTTGLYKKITTWVQKYIVSKWRLFANNCFHLGFTQRPSSELMEIADVGAARDLIFVSRTLQHVGCLLTNGWDTYWLLKGTK